MSEARGRGGRGRRCRVGRAEVDTVTEPEAVALVLELARPTGGDRRLVVTPNIQHVALLETDRELFAAYQHAALALPDGWPVAVAVSALTRRKQPRVSGADLLPRLCEAAEAQDLSVGFLGGAPGAARRAAEALVARHPRLKVTLVLDPPRGFEHQPAVLQDVLGAVAEASPAVLFVGLGTPKQERFAHEHAVALGDGVAVCVGAAIDFAAGVVRRAPRPLRVMGLEWLWRIALEPRRLLGRYVTSGPVFVKVVARQLLRDRSLRRHPEGRA